MNDTMKEFEAFLEEMELKERLANTILIEAESLLQCKGTLNEAMSLTNLIINDAVKLASFFKKAA